MNGTVTMRITNTILSTRPPVITSLDTMRRPGTRAATRPSIAETATAAPPALEPPVIGQRATTPPATHPAGMPVGAAAVAADTTPLRAATQRAITPPTTIPDRQAKDASPIDEWCRLGINVSIRSFEQARRCTTSEYQLVSREWFSAF